MTGDQWVQKWIVPSNSGSGEYIVSKHQDGHFACSCIGWTRHTPRTDCRHIRDVKAGSWPTEEDYTLAKLAGKDPFSQDWSLDRETRAKLRSGN